MATIAIELDRSLELPGIPAVPRAKKSRAQVHGRFVSKAVRLRNEGAGKPWWQPSTSLFRSKPSRSRTIAVEIKQELDSQALAPEDFWAMPVTDVAAYEAERALEEAAEIETRHHVILDGIEDEFHAAAEDLIGHRRCDKLKTLVGGLRAERMLATSPGEIQELDRRIDAAQLALDLTRNDLEVLRQYASAA